MGFLTRCNLRLMSQMWRYHCQIGIEDRLRIHAAICRIAWLPGASALFDELEADIDEDFDLATEISNLSRSLYARLEHHSLLMEAGSALAD